MRKNFGIILVFVLMVLIVLALFPLPFLMNPIITPEEYLSSIPYVKIFTVILIKPSSTFIVYFLGVITIYIGVLLYKDKEVETKKWWGLSLIFWGIGTLLAGSSYQGFGYELKCYGHEFCLFTNWFELSYLFITAISITIMGKGVSIKTLNQDSRNNYVKIIYLGLVVYVISMLIGTVFEIYFLITYEWFLVFFLPYFLSYFILNIRSDKMQSNPLDKGLINVWILMLFINILYFIYLFSGINEYIYEQFSIWFSANDVLHIGLIYWMYYIYKTINKSTT